MKPCTIDNESVSMSSRDVLTDILRRGAQDMLADAIENEVAEYIRTHCACQATIGPPCVRRKPKRTPLAWMRLSRTQGLPSLWAWDYSWSTPASVRILPRVASDRFGHASINRAKSVSCAAFGARRAPDFAPPSPGIVVFDSTSGESAVFPLIRRDSAISFDSTLCIMDETSFIWEHDYETTRQYPHCSKK